MLLICRAASCKFRRLSLPVFFIRCNKCVSVRCNSGCRRITQAPVSFDFVSGLTQLSSQITAVIVPLTCVADFCTSQLGIWNLRKIWLQTSRKISETCWHQNNQRCWILLYNLISVVQFSVAALMPFASKKYVLWNVYLPTALWIQSANL